MAPEQLSGKEVTARSDIYSLGLVLYEMFTGKAAFDGKTLEEIVRVRRDSTPHRPSTIVRDMDPLVERAILRCLEADPENRPGIRADGFRRAARRRSAGRRAGRGRNAFAAGGRRRRRHQRSAGAHRDSGDGRGADRHDHLFMCSARTSGMAKIDMPDSSEVLAQRARDIVHQLGYTDAGGGLRRTDSSGTTITWNIWTTPAASIPTGTSC